MKKNDLVLPDDLTDVVVLICGALIIGGLLLGKGWEIDAGWLIFQIGGAILIGWFLVLVGAHVWRWWRDQGWGLS